MRAAIGLLLCLLLAGCGTALARAGHSTGVSIPGTPAGSRDLGPLAPDASVSFVLALTDRQAALSRYLAAVENPDSPRFGQTLSLTALDRRYGPRPSAIASARRFLRRLGLRTKWTPGSAWMLVSGQARAVERAFRATLDRFVAPDGTRFYASTHAAAVPPPLRPTVATIGRISDALRRVPAVSTRADGLSPTDFLAAYDLTPLRQAGLTGKGLTVAFIEADGFRQSDLDSFTRRYHLPTLHPSIKFGRSIRQVEGETEMDMEVVHEIAPGAAITVYNCPNQCGDTDIIKAEDAAVRGTAHGIISISLGGCEADESRGALRSEYSNFNRADALGESVFVASGDSGAFTCLTRDWGSPPTARDIGVSSPASMPGVTAVGGTRLNVNGNGTWQAEQVWESPLETAGSGGGISGVFARPSWQRAPGVSTILTGGRDVPDVAAVADPDTSPAVVIAGQLVTGGGTSEAAPTWAGMTALIDQYLGKQKLHRAGFLNPALYALASGSPAYPPFHDITVGSNLVDPAGPGYDLATGLGTPDGWNLARDLAAYLGKKP